MKPQLLYLETKLWIWHRRGLGSSGLRCVRANLEMGALVQRVGEDIGGWAMIAPCSARQPPSQMMEGIRRVQAIAAKGVWQ
jgi:hypothetical protein